MRSKYGGVLVFLITVSIVIALGVHIIANAKDHHQNSEACARTLPANIDLSRDFERTLARIYRRSATFRGQCDRIGAAETLSVSIQIDTAIPSTCMAFTRFRRKGLELYAEVHVPPTGLTMPQLVGHEFEHIVEQLDGLNLRALSRIRGSGVYLSSPDVFETIRAQYAGRSVARETVAARTAD
jgi:hypothetical protein